MAQYKLVMKEVDDAIDEVSGGINSLTETPEANIALINACYENVMMKAKQKLGGFSSIMDEKTVRAYIANYLNRKGLIKALNLPIIAYKKRK